jgi:integrase
MGNGCVESTKTENKQLAQEYHDMVKAERWKEQRLGVKPDVKFTDAVLTFLEDKSHLKNVDGYELLLNWWTDEFKELTLRDITQERIISTINKKRKDITPATCNRYLAVLRGVMRMACLKYQWIERVPMFFMFEEPKCRVRWLKADEVARLLDALPEHLRPMAALSFATGLRQSNVKDLKWSQVDLARRVIQIDGDEMKNSNAHGIPLSDAAVEIIRQEVGKHDEKVFTYRGRPIRQIGNAT